jgi:glycogen debranching enzyme
VPLPTWEESRCLLPQVVWPGRPDVVSCHDRAWELAFSHLHQAVKESGFVSNYIDSAFNDDIFMWDSTFITMFGRYGARAFPFQNTLDNFYARQHRDGYICRQISNGNGGEVFTRFDPCSTGPNVMAWSEWQYYETTGDMERLAMVFEPLLAYHEWLRAHHTWPNGAYFSCGWGCGMDNQPRLMPGENVEFSHGHMVWLDATLQAVLSCKTMIKMARVLNRGEEIPPLQKEAEMLARYVNDALWDDNDAFYYDLWKTGELNRAKSIGAYWALLAGVVPAERMERFVAHLSNEREFKRPHRVPSLSADDKLYHPDGAYWRGGVWAPTNYMVLRGLQAAGCHDLAYEIASNHLDNVVKVCAETGTLWENYKPESAAPGEPARKDFVGWSGLPPVCVLYEYVFGITSDAASNTVHWRLRQKGTHGILRYPLKDGTVDLMCEASGDDLKITAKAAFPAKVVVTGLAQGEKTIELP